MSESAGPAGANLRRRAISSFFWSYGGLFGGKIAFFLATLILARLLEPEDFGLVAFALAALAYINNLTVHGPGEALVFRSDAHSQRVASTAYWLSIGMSVAFTAIIWLFAPLIGRFTDDDAIWILRILSIQLVIGSLASTHGYLLRHSLEFRRLFLPDQLGGIVRGVVSVALALAGAGVWSLVWGQLAGSLASSGLLMARSGWRPRFTIAPEEVLPTFRLGFAFTVVAILGEAARNVDFIIVGLQRGADDLGFYVLAFRLPELAILALFEIAWGVLFPFYSRVRDAEVTTSADSLTRSYLGTVRLGSLLAFPLGLGMAALARPLVLVLYGDKWEPSIGPLAFIAVWAALTAIAGLPGTLFKAVGRPGLLTRCIVFYLVILVPSLWFAGGFGITQVAAAHVVAQGVYLVFLWFVLARITSLAWRSNLTALLPGLTVGVITGAAVLPVALLLPPVVGLVAGVAVGFLVFVGAARLVVPEELRALARFLQDRLTRRAAPGEPAS